MRFWVLVLAIVLLPLRALGSDTMAVQMAVQALAAGRVAPLPPPESMTHGDHAGHGAGPAVRAAGPASMHGAHGSRGPAVPGVVHADLRAGARPDASHATGPGTGSDAAIQPCASSCGDCQLCNASIAGGGIAPLALSRLPRHAPAVVATGFRSLTPKPGLKPPIA